MLTLDHIAISTETLATGAADVEAALDLSLAPGGVHDAMGTHNRLLSLGPEEYLEVIAIDPDGNTPSQPRWFDLDNFGGPTRSTTWICRCPDLEKAIAAAPDGIGVPWDLARNDLRWRMAVPRDGKLPFGGLFPALIEWMGDVHPAPRLPDASVRLEKLTFESPEADAFRAALAPLISDPRIEIIAGSAPKVTTTLVTPNGRVTL